MLVVGGGKSLENGVHLTSVDHFASDECGVKLGDIAPGDVLGACYNIRIIPPIASAIAAFFQTKPDIVGCQRMMNALDGKLRQNVSGSSSISFSRMSRITFHKKVQMAFNGTTEKIFPNRFNCNPLKCFIGFLFRAPVPEDTKILEVFLPPPRFQTRFTELLPGWRSSRAIG